MWRCSEPACLHTDPVYNEVREHERWTHYGAEWQDAYSQASAAMTSSQVPCSNLWPTISGAIPS
ncbi:hypothetical protein BJ970_007648 [Saccharopolyspora phatthalungensis]|uniref:Uncharacterized protein n=1 Tax=Saccharopolyspora phatthalungensis TaxID=664693 RepID=A0A840QIG1_9PSEU|nr:hypothetical protein [Saccharopolyspora phatthalungensis]